MSLALSKSPAETTTSLPHHEQPFLCHSPQMTRMIHWYRISRQRGRGSAEVSWLESCLALSKAAASHYGLPLCLTKPLSEAIAISACVQQSGICSGICFGTARRKTDDSHSVLLRSYVQVAVVTTNSHTELATLAARCHPRNPLYRLSPRDHRLTPPSRRLSRTRAEVPMHIPGSSPSHSLPPSWCWCRKLAVRSACKSLGKEACVPARFGAHDSELCLGRIYTRGIQLHEFAMGTSDTGSRFGSV